jgi:hypothetical protein
MQHRLALKHLSGGRAGKVDMLAPPADQEIIFGRDRECHVRYEETDDLVSRRHFKIVITRDQPVRYMVVDLGSRNGTFVNRQRVFGATPLQPGGRVQLGAGGPEFEFQLDKEERERRTKSGGKPKPAANGDVAHKRKTGPAMRVFTILVLLTVGAAAYLAWSNVAPFWRNWQRTQAAGPRFTAAAALASVATVESEWSILDKRTGIRLARAYVGNERVSGDERLPLIDGAPATLPAFVLLEDHRMEPLLVPSGAAAGGRPVGGKWAAKGVIVSETGAALAPTQESKPWSAAHSWAADESAGALFVLDAGRIKQVVPLAAAQFPRWMPAESGWLAEQVPEEWRGEMHGRRVSSDDLRVEVSVSITASGRRLRARADESDGFLLAVPQPGVPSALIHAPMLGDAVGPSGGAAVWVVGDQVEAGAIESLAEDGALRLTAPLCDQGGVVFDEQGRALALCVPDAHSSAGGAAVTVRRGLDLFQGAAHGQSW